MTKVRAVLLAAYALLVAASFAYGYLAHRALDFDPSDGTFYLGFYEKAFDARAAHLIQPEGRNLFFFSGTDGERGLHQDIHFEPVKYLLAALMQLAGSPAAVMLALALIAYSPLLYGALLARAPGFSRTDALILLAYAAAPALLFGIGSSLRPIVLLPAVFMLAMMALCYRRPAGEALALFALLFFIREESLVLGLALALAALGFARLRQEKPPLAYLGIWGAGIAAFVLYMLWTGYPITLTSEKIARHISIPLLGALVALLAALALLIFLRFRAHLLRFLSVYAALAASGLALAVTLAHLVVDDRLRAIPWTDLARANYTGLFFAGVAAALLAARVLSTKRDAVLRPILLAAIGLALASQLALPGFALDLSRSFLKRLPDVELVHEARRAHTDRVLASYATISAWYAADEVYALERLPASLAQGPARFYPENEPLLQGLFRSDAFDAIVVGASQRPLVEKLAKETGASLALVRENAAYAWYTLR